MLENKVVQEKLEMVFEEDYIQGKIIQSTEKKAILLIETTKTYTLVSVANFTNMPIGDVDIFVEHRVEKTGDTLQDMVSIIRFLQIDFEKSAKLNQDKLLEVAGDIIEIGKTFKKASVLSIDNN